MLVTVARLAIRAHQHRRLFLDDAFLLVGCACLCAGTGVLHRLLPVLYLDERLILEPETTPLVPQDIENFIWYQKMAYSFVTVTWVTIFAVKFSFLFFFRKLISRLSGMITYWKIVISVTVVACGFSVCEKFIACPHFNLSAGKEHRVGPSDHSKHALTL